MADEPSREALAAGYALRQQIDLYLHGQITLAAQQEVEAQFARALDEFARAAVERAINTPETADFLAGVAQEARHQRERWGEAHDRGKSAENWYWLVGYLAGKALRAHVDGDVGKAAHHTISSAAALYQWHAAIQTDQSGHGIGSDADLDPENSHAG